MLHRVGDHLVPTSQEPLSDQAQNLRSTVTEDNVKRIIDIEEPSQSFAGIVDNAARLHGKAVAPSARARAYLCQEVENGLNDLGFGQQVEAVSKHSMRVSPSAVHAHRSGWGELGSGTGSRLARLALWLGSKREREGRRPSQHPGFRAAT